MCKLSRATLLCKMQEMCDITDGGLHRTMTWWFLIVENGVTWWFDRSACLEARRKVETTGLIALTFPKHLHLCLGIWLLSSGLCAECESFPSGFVCGLLPGSFIWNSLIASFLPCDLHVSVCLLFSRSVWSSVSRVYPSVVKTIYWLTVTKRGLKC